ncbi:PLP-dependent transferase [Basidiobolus meristosporus CBS 931.73]|uniref:PLP-dependent transferase n=1 Tax=Basidiobolus meristosporus CBS 931.73 TaxID=1314790 RepID=A0A1Y1YZ78_9FUNG|nr:PLP-dependent transferase [Basidiobolus meristosporus CBS 931.73]|eukprot:ORY02997.1 PLP-dependent transferase [Basidiobolus meristosporus CBS 931.73]
MKYLSDRSKHVHQVPKPLIEGGLRYMANPYNVNTNSEGIINIGVAENSLMHEELLQKLKPVLTLEKEFFNYGMMCGTLELRTLLAGLFNRHYNPAVPVQASHITVHNGAGPSIDLLAYIISDPGDGVLITTPYYGGFDYDFAAHAETKVVPVDLNGTDPFQMDHIDRLECAISKAKGEGIRVRAILLCNPHNPLGRCYPAEVLVEILRFANRHQIHVISDEIYGLSWFKRDSEETPFTSLLSIPNLSDLIDPKLVHFIWSFSKDFCMNGLRVGIVMSPFNPEVVQTLQALSMFNAIPNTSDHLMCQLLKDTTWVDWFIQENQRRLLENYTKTQELLERNQIQYHPCTAGHFIWTDFTSTIQRIATTHGLEKSERILWNAFLENGVYSSLGEAFHSSEPGYFRITFSIPWETLSLGLSRLIRVVNSFEEK